MSAPDGQDRTRITSDQVVTAGIDDWRLLQRALHARFTTGSFTAGLALVTAVAEAAEAANHHPDVTLTYPFVDVALHSHDVGSVTRRDVELARRISVMAAEQGVVADPSVLAELEVGLDTAALAAQGPFWSVLLTGSAEAFVDEDVRDPGGRLPTLWFQEADGPRDAPDGQRFHLDLWLPVDVAAERIALALETGGTLVDDGATPTFTVLADPEGNRVCVCTAVDR